MSFQVLEGLASSWADLVDHVDPKSGPGSLLRMSRSLFAHAWFDYEFMVVACLIGFQALEAAYRRLYPSEERVPFRALVRRSLDDGALPPNIAKLAETGVELRNLYSHPEMQAALTVGMAGSMLENTHRLVGVIVEAAERRVSRKST